MSLSLKPLLFLHHHHRRRQCYNHNDFPCFTSSCRLSRDSTRFSFLQTSPNHFHYPPRRRLRLRSVNGDDNVPKPIVSEGGSMEKNADNRESPTPRQVLMKLKRYGISGILSYGLLNTAYYLTTFLLVWFYVAPVPGKMGYFAAAERFLKVMAMVWAGSQVTKLVRAGGALALAPFVDRGLSLFTAKFKFKTQEKAFTAIVGFCFGLAIILFVVITLLWA